jgi:hypothetical protein
MFDIGTLTTAASIALGVLTWAALVRIFGNADPAEVTSIFGRPWEPAWPRGVQEEEPLRWHLGEPVRVAAAAGPTPRALPSRAAEPACDECADEVAA